MAIGTIIKKPRNKLKYVTAVKLLCHTLVFFLNTVVTMVLIFNGNSEHVAHEKMKIGLLYEEITP